MRGGQPSQVVTGGSLMTTRAQRPPALLRQRPQSR